MKKISIPGGRKGGPGCDLITHNCHGQGGYNVDQEAGRKKGRAKKYPRLQIPTVEGLLGGKEIDYPPTGANVTFKKAPKAEEDEQEAVDLPFKKGR